MYGWKVQHASSIPVEKDKLPHTHSASGPLRVLQGWCTSGRVFFSVSVKLTAALPAEWNDIVRSLSLPHSLALSLFFYLLLPSSSLRAHWQYKLHSSAVFSHCRSSSCMSLAYQSVPWLLKGNATSRVSVRLITTPLHSHYDDPPPPTIFHHSSWSRHSLKKSGGGGEVCGWGGSKLPQFLWIKRVTLFETTVCYACSADTIHLGHWQWPKSA